MIEQAFGLLKGKWRRLMFLPFRSMQRICYFINACLVLHNLGILVDGRLYDDDEDYQEDVEEVGEYGNDDISGEAKRDRLRMDYC